MEVIDKLGIKVPNAVLVSGSTGPEKHEDILDFLKTYGLIDRAEKIDDPTTGFHTNLIVEYNHGTAVQMLEPVLPLTHPSSVSPDVTFHVQALASVYTQKGRQGYDLEKLKGIRKLSGKDFEEVLKEVMSQIEESIDGAESSEHVTSPQHSLGAEKAAEPSQHHGCWLVLPLPLILVFPILIRNQLLSPFTQRYP